MAAVPLALLLAPVLLTAARGEPDVPSTPAALQYIESSSGLSVPGLEGGKTELEFADLDGDGNVDIVSIGDHGNPGINSGQRGLMVWFGNGLGSWSHYQTGEFGYGGIAIGDADLDGTLDAGYAMHHNYSGVDLGDQLIEVARGDGTGRNWTPWDDGLATDGETYGMFATDFADVDNDGDLDIGVLSFGCCNGLRVYLNNRDGTWIPAFASDGGNSTTNEFVFGDVDGDGNADFAAGSQNGTVWLGDGTGGFALADGNLPAGGILGRRGSDLGDVDRDGRQDLSLVNTSGGVEVWLWRGNSTWLKASTGLPATGGFLLAQLEDMNGDGSMDLVAFGSGTVRVWTGDGGSTWSQQASFNVGNPGNAQALRVGGDADHNGRPDIALVEDEYTGVFSTRNKLKFYREATPASALKIRGTYPRGGETLAEGSARFIEWATEVPAGQTARVRLELSTSGAGGPWSLIADDLPDSGRRQWTVPPGAASGNCLIRYTATTPADATATAVTMAPFTIAVADSDGDGAANWQDCALADAGAHAPPVEVTGLRAEPDPADPAGRVLVRWDSQSASAGTGTVYDLITGPVSDLGPDGLLDQASCRGDDLPVPEASVTLAPAPGTASYILARAENVCATGPWGAAFSGTPRTASACP